MSDSEQEIYLAAADIIASTLDILQCCILNALATITIFYEMSKNKKQLGHKKTKVCIYLEQESPCQPVKLQFMSMFPYSYNNCSQDFEGNKCHVHMLD